MYKDLNDTNNRSDKLSCNQMLDDNQYNKVNNKLSVDTCLDKDDYYNKFGSDPITNQWELKTYNN